MNTPPLDETLNEREREIIGLLSQGLSNGEIAERLFLAPSTVKWYIRQLNSKLHTTNRDEIVDKANQLGLLTNSAPDELFLRPRYNLPHQTTPFVGRDAELDELHTIIEKPEVRLLTIAAPGGMGKTRIALETAEQQRNRFPDGVYFVPLQALSTVDQIIPTIASSVSFQGMGDSGEKAQFLNFLAHQQMLLVIDNCEHLLEGINIFAEILNTAPKVKILATSRERLNLSIETLYSLTGLAFPSRETLENVMQYDAVELLQQTAHYIKSDWQITKENIVSVLKICQLTEGMPLGILLAMSWLNILRVEEIASEIERSIDFLEANYRDVHDRQHSIRAIFNATWQRLTVEEQSFFMKMSIFRGGFTRQAAEQVTGITLRSLQTLIGKSLIQLTREGRYTIHELLRQYAEEKISEHPDEHLRLKQVYCEYFMAFAEQHLTFIMTEKQAEIMTIVQPDLMNIESAWDYSIEYKREDLLIQINEMMWVYELLGLHKIGYQRFERSLAIVSEENDFLRGHLMRSLTGFCLRLGYWEKGKDFAIKAIELLKNTEAHTVRLQALTGLAGVMRYLEGSEAQETLLMEGLLEAQKLNSTTQYMFLSDLGTVYRNRGETDRALDFLTKSLEFKSNPWGRSGIFYHIGATYLRMDKFSQAETHLQYGFNEAKSLNYRAGVTLCGWNLAYIAYLRNDKHTMNEYALQARHYYSEILGHVTVTDFFELINMLEDDRFEAAKQTILNIQILEGDTDLLVAATRYLIHQNQRELALTILIYIGLQNTMYWVNYEAARQLALLDVAEDSDLFMKAKEQAQQHSWESLISALKKYLGD